MTVQRTRHDKVLVVEIDRPDRRNAVDRDTAETLADAFRDFDRDDALEVAVLHGRGGHFCAGADLKALAEGHGNRFEEDGDGPLGPTRMQLVKPVIAAVEGYAVAGGLELALWCDLRVAAEGAVFGVFCRRFGVPLIDRGAVRLPRLIGQGRALDMILTGRAVDCDEALAIGLVDRRVPDGSALNRAIELAGQIAAHPQVCLRNDRRLALAQWSLDESSLQALEYELGRDSLASGEAIAGARRFSDGAGRGGQGT